MHGFVLDQLTVSVVGVCVTAMGLVLIAVQISFAHRIARGQNTMPFLLGEQIRELRKKESEASNGVYDPAQRIQLAPEMVELILNDKELRDAVKAKLNYYEAICCAMRRGTLDQKLFETFSSRNLRLQFWLYIHYIAWARNADGTSAYADMEWIARKWDRSWRVSHRIFDREGYIITGKTYEQLKVPETVLHKILKPDGARNRPLFSEKP